MTHLAAQRAGMIRAEYARQLGTSDWAWRSAKTESITDEIARYVVAQLQSDAHKARAWVTAAARRIGLALPVGNGTNGPWQLQAVLDVNDRFGVLDISRGWIAWTDTIAPAYVRRFALSCQSAVSPHDAGGSGKMGSAVKQIALTYSGEETARIVAPRPSVTWIEWGMQTCYGSVGNAPDATYLFSDWKPIIESGVPIAETATPQWDVLSGVETRLLVAEPVAQQWLRSCPHWGRILKLRKSGSSHNGVAEVEIQVFGASIAERAEVKAKIAAHWICWAKGEMRRRAAELIRDFARDAGINVADIPETRFRGRREWDVKNANVQNYLFNLLATHE